MILLLRCEMDEEEEQKMLQHLHFLADSTVRFSHPGMLLGSLSVAIYIKECILRVFNVILFMQTFAKYRNKYKKNKSFHSFILTLWLSLSLSFCLSPPLPFIDIFRSLDCHQVCVGWSIHLREARYCFHIVF